VRVDETPPPPPPPRRIAVRAARSEFRLGVSVANRETVGEATAATAAAAVDDGSMMVTFVSVSFRTIYVSYEIVQSKARKTEQYSKLKVSEMRRIE
jgi:hypothetical protein